MLGYSQSNDFLREIWSPRPFISSGGHTRESAFEFAERGDLVAFGRLFISNVSFLPRPRVQADLNSDC